MVVSRRTLLAASALAPAAALWGAPPASARPAQPPIRPRADWGAERPARGRLEDESDVRFLLVHHSQTPNDDAPGRTAERLRSIHRFHTGAERGWADVAYNFFVDRHGVIWEGREGSLTRPVMGDATGGSQGHALLCCFLGDFTSEEPTEVAMRAMVSLLAWLAGREGLDLAAPVTFTSRGSTKWRRGAEVTTEQVAAHRDMSATECPGAALYPLVFGRLLPEARALLAPSSTPVPTPTPAATPGPSASTAPAAAAPAPTDPDWTLVRGIAGGVTLAALGGLVAAARGGRRSAGEVLEEQEHPADGEGGEQPDQEAPQGR